MNEQYYTNDNQHPEDAIYKAKTFINELQKVQERYFDELVSNLRLTKCGEDWLFDYVYNTTDQENYDGFDHYLQDYKQKYTCFVKTQDTMYNNCDAFRPTDFGEFSPMMHMSSCEPSLATAFPSPYDCEDQISSELDTITTNERI